MGNCPDIGSWVDKAEEDVRAAQVLCAADLSGFAGTIVFHCQQAAEKYLKACLVGAAVSFPRTHDLEQLLTMCISISAEFEGLQHAADRLQPYAVAARYPHAAPLESEVKRAVEDMGQVCGVCRNRLEKARP
ncbi:MAG: HEPN domain-containing protein [Planctomycetota bacterium]